MIILLWLIYIGVATFLVSWFLITLGYPKLGMCKKLMHDKCNIHVPDFNNNLLYEDDTKTVYTTCKYCKKPLVYKPVCKYLVMYDTAKIPESIFNEYCMNCKRNNYTKNKRCCPLYCDGSGICKGCIR